jgi:hypothetical protein
MSSVRGEAEAWILSDVKVEVEGQDTPRAYAQRRRFKANATIVRRKGTWRRTDSRNRGADGGSFVVKSYVVAKVKLLALPSTMKSIALGVVGLTRIAKEVN